MTCEEALVIISAKLDGEATILELAELETHLASCPTCRALEADLSGLHAAMADWEELPAVDLVPGVMARISATKVKKFPQLKRWGALAAVFALVVMSAGSLKLLADKTSAPKADPIAVVESTPKVASPAPDVGDVRAVPQSPSKVQSETEPHPVLATAMPEKKAVTAPQKVQKTEPDTLLPLQNNALTYTAETRYCGVLTLNGDRPLNLTALEPYRQETADGTDKFLLPTEAFCALVAELEDSADASLRETGEDISATATVGLVLVISAK
ncbi:MAG: zf-HC2 domain-containing protein [Oscillospiraceae bacterium]